MRKTFILAFALAAISASAQIVSVPLFPTSPSLIENYDALPVGSFPAISIFGGTGSAKRIGSGGALIVGHFGPKTPPNMMFGRGVDVSVHIKPAMTFFGGYFKQALSSPKVTKVTFKFFDAANNPIGSVTKPLTPVWTWIGFKTTPKWTRVDVLGNGALHGYVAFDATRVRP
jgi:hypothetical protein